MKKGYSIVCATLAGIMLLSAFAGCNYNKSETPLETVEPEITQEDESFDEEETYEETLPANMLSHFPDGISILGVDVSGLSADEAYLKVSDEIMQYTLSVTVNGENVTYTAADLGIGLSVVSFNGLLYRISRDPNDTEGLGDDYYTYAEDAVISAISAFPGISSTAKDAYIKYDSGSKKFVAVNEVIGYGIDTHPIIEAVSAAIEAREPSVDLTVAPSDVVPNITTNSAKLQNALSHANAFLALNLTYVFDPSTGSKHIDKLSVSDIASLIYVKGDGLSIGVNGDALNKFCNRKASERGVFGQSVGFTTTSGDTLNMNAINTGELVDTDDLYQDLDYRLSRCISGTHNVAYYIVRPGDVSGNYGGNYIEINLTTQHLWCYKNGAIAVSTDIVSGCVRAGHRTPTGVFTIRSKSRNCYLIGPDYRSFVNYWMPFNGGIGLHDADGWRRSYGGSIYLNNGSHGCINMPKSAAASIYNTASVGYHVIVYGGQGSVSSPQSISGTSYYYKNVGDSAFTLDSRPRYTSTLNFTSNNTSVATVGASSGIVTVKGEGTAIITVSCPGESCRFYVYVYVYPAGVDIEQYRAAQASASAAAAASASAEAAASASAVASDSAPASGSAAASGSSGSASAPTSSGETQQAAPSSEAAAPSSEAATPSPDAPAPQSQEAPPPSAQAPEPDPQPSDGE
ncbi:MAG: L,D-transpeptidase [Saccharofermentans sp.]|nr:L,D-transpeptidase [Saccharofermentans sp.]